MPRALLPGGFAAFIPDEPTRRVGAFVAMRMARTMPGCGRPFRRAMVDVAVKRWQAFTGLEAKLDGDGRSFEEIALERAAQDRRPEPASRVWGPS